MKKPITDAQALDWSFRQVDELMKRWIDAFERLERIADNEPRPTMRAAARLQANTYKQCGLDMKDLYFGLRLLTAPDQPIPLKLKLVIDNDPGGDHE